MDWRTIPSLAALRAFEAAARTGSLSAAARELNVTHAAIAQHLRTLTDHFGEVLLEREGRGMHPTAAGRVLAAGLSDGFGRIAEAVGQIGNASDARPLAVTTTPNFAENWLMPRLCDFWVGFPDIPLSIIPTHLLTDLRREGYDLAIRYGRGNWPGYDSELLLSVAYLVAAAPGLMREGRQAKGDLAGQTWLFEEGREEPYLWAKSAGLIAEDTNIKKLATVGMILPALRSGAGIAIVSRALVARDLETGSLVPLLEEPQEDLGYYLVTRPGLVSPRLRIFVKWLKAEAEQA